MIASLLLLCVGVGIGMIVVAAILIQPIIYTTMAWSNLKHETDGSALTHILWINKCLDGASQILKQEANTAIITTQSQMGVFSFTLWMYILLVTLLLLVIIFLLLCMYKRDDYRPLDGVYGVFSFYE